MSTPASVYTESNCQFAYQLRWGLTVFWRQPVSEQEWLSPFQESLNADHLKILSWRWLTVDSVQFAVSSRPEHSPYFVVQRIKGRLQYSVRSVAHKALRPHYAIRSYGTQNRSVVEAYIQKQPRHHRMAAEHTQRLFDDLVFVDPKVDLSIPQKSSHGDYWNNLHVVLVHSDRWNDVNPTRRRATQQAMVLEAQRRKWRLSRCAILADHVHASLGCHLEDAPQAVIMNLMNRVAEVYDGQAILQFSGYIGTFGEYDQRAIQGDHSGD